MAIKEKMNPNKIARVAGFLYLIMVPFAIFGIKWASSLIVPGDATITASNIMASESLFRLSIVSALIVQIVHILLVLVLYKLLKPVNKTHALLMVIFMLVAVPIAMLNELNRFAALLLSSGADYLTAFTADQLPAQVMLFLNLQEHGVFIAQIFWGLWLFPMGYLVFKSGFLPRILGILLIIAGFGYLINSVTFFLFPNFDAIIIQFTFYGELLLPLWLLIKGVNVEQWEKRALESA
ncbi:hypothetical protein ES707_16411 [subsurface metagenome]